MKKKLLITMILALSLAFLFAICVSAEGPKDLFSEVTILDNINKTDTFGYGETDFSRVVLEDPDNEGAYVTYPMYYLFTKRDHASEGNQPVINFSYILNATGKQYSEKSIICLEIPEAFTAVSGHYSHTNQMTNLQYIKFPKNLWIIHGSAFRSNKSLSIIEFQNNTAEGASLNIYDYTFDDCDALTRVDFPIQLKKLGERSFGDCDLLETVNFAEGTDFTLYNDDGTIKENTLFASFIYDPSLKSLRLPDGITSTGSVTCNGCSSLEYVYIPASCKSFGAQAFNNCVSLKVIEFAPGSQLETIGAKAIAESSQITSITFPNTFLTATGEAPIRNLKNLTYINFGASFVGFTGYASMYSTENAELVIVLPTTFDTKYVNELPKKATILYTGDKTQAEAFGYATMQTYEEWVEAGSPKGNRIVYGYNKCDAFYGGTHALSENPIEKFEGEEYTSRYISVCTCTNGCGKDVVTELCAPLFVNKGYSKEIDGTFFNYSFVANKEAIALYEEITGETLSYGIIAAQKSLSQNGALLDENGKAIEGAIAMSFDTTSYDTYNVKITGISEKFRASELYCCAYVYEAGTASYIGEAVTELASLISYDRINADDTEE